MVTSSNRNENKLFRISNMSKFKYDWWRPMSQRVDWIYPVLTRSFKRMLDHATWILTLVEWGEPEEEELEEEP
jgi:hypothetical protein